MTSRNRPLIQVSDLSIGYDGHALLRDMSFDVARGDVFVIMGGSGSGKSTLLRAMTGLVPPMSGTVKINGTNIWTADAAARHRISQNMGVLFQGGALFSSMTVGENVALPLRAFAHYSDAEIRRHCRHEIGDGWFVRFPGFLSIPA